MLSGYKSNYEIVTADDNLPGKVMLYEKPGRDCFISNHRHKNLEIDYIVRGRMWTNLDGEDRDIHEGEYVLINAEVNHQTCGKVPDETVKYLVVQFSYSYIKAYFPDVDRYWFDLNKSDQSRSRIREMLKAIVFECENESDFSKLKITCAMSQILLLLFTKCRVQRPVDEEMEKIAGDAYITRAVDFITRHYAERISLEDISEYVGLTPTYFSRYFKNTTHQTFKNYLNLVRLKNTLLDIQNFGYSETEASKNNGFPSVKSFIAVFKSVYGCAPSEYQKLYHEQPPIAMIEQNRLLDHSENLSL